MIYYYNQVNNLSECCGRLRQSKVHTDFMKFMEKISKGRENNADFCKKLIYDCADYLQYTKSIKSDKLNELRSYDILLNCIKEYKQERMGVLDYLATGNVMLRKGQYLGENFISNQNCYESAERHFDWICKLEGKQPKEHMLALNNLGKCAREHGKKDHKKYSEAIAYFEEVANFKPDVLPNTEKDFFWNISLNATNNIGICYLKQLNFSDAQANFFNVIKRSMELSYTNGTSLEADLSSIIEICNPLKVKSHNEIKAYFEKNKKIYEKIMFNLDTNNQIDGDLPKNTHLLQAMINLGILKRKCSNFEDAIAIFQFIKAKTNSKNIDAINNLGICYRKRGEWQSALELFDIVLEKTPHNDFAKLNKMKCQIKMKEFTDVEDQLKKMQDDNKQNAEVQLILGIYYRDKGQFEKAIEIFKQICDADIDMEKGSVRLKAYYNIGICYNGQHKFNKAKKIFKKILDLHSEDVLAQLNLGWCLQNLGNHTGASECYKKLKDNNTIRLYTRNCVFNNLGECNYYLKKYDEAIACFKEVLNQDPHNAESLCYTANCMRMKKEYEGAIENYELSLQYSPFNEYAKSKYVICLVEYLEKLDWMNENEKNIEVGKRIDAYLRHPIKNYSLEACLAFLKYILHCDEKAQEAAYRLFAKLLPSEREENYVAFNHFWLKKPIQKISDTDKGKIIGELLGIYLHIANIKNICRLSLDPSKCHDISYAHYTKISTLKLLLSQNENPKPRLRLLNTIYMNDPAEGKAFIETLRIMGKNGADNNIDQLSLYFPYENESETEDFANFSNVYLTSLSTLNDNLPMWVQYADGARGCSIVFDDDFFDIKYDVPENLIGHYTADDYPLYHVQYIDPAKILDNQNSEMRKIRDELTSILKHIACLEEKLKSLNTAEVSKEIRVFVADILNEIRYLFKYKEYEHENEIRIVRSSNQIKIDETSFAIPRLFIEIEKDISIKEVQLGSLVTNFNEVASWLYATGKVKKVSRSARHYK